MMTAEAGDRERAEWIAAEEASTAGIVGRMVERDPNWGNLRTLWHSARTANALKRR